MTAPFDSAAPAPLQSLINDEGERAATSLEGSHQEMKQAAAKVEGIPSSAIKDVMIEAELSLVTEANLAQCSSNSAPPTSQNSSDDEQLNFAPGGKRKC